MFGFTQIAVTVSLPGYRPKTTPILLEDEAVSLDFILEPEDGDAGRRIQIGDCDCDFHGVENLELVEILRRTHMEVYLPVFLFLLFLYFLSKRKAIFRFVKQRQSSSHRRLVVV